MLDAASILCVKSTKYPVKNGDQAVEVDWQYDVVWSHTGYFYAKKTASPFCPVSTTYPASAIRKNEEGSVAFTYSVGVDGNATNLQVVQSSGFADLDQAVLDCVKSKSYPVATQGGRPIPIDMTYRIKFMLSAGRSPSPPLRTVHATSPDDAVEYFPCNDFVRTEDGHWSMSPQVVVAVPNFTFAPGTPLTVEQGHKLDVRCHE
jgi:TonB family protein